MPKQFDVQHLRKLFIIKWSGTNERQRHRINESYANITKPEHNTSTHLANPYDHGTESNTGELITLHTNIHRTTPRGTQRSTNTGTQRQTTHTPHPSGQDRNMQGNTDHRAHQTQIKIEPHLAIDTEGEQQSRPY